MTPPSPSHAHATRSISRVARVAVLSIALGFAVQGVVLALILWGGGEARAAVAQGAGGVAWAALVCTGVAVGTVVARGRPILAGLVAAALAPTSLAVAKASQKVMSGWLGAAQTEAVLSLGAVSLIRAVEYGVLGWLLGSIAAAGRERAEPYLASGAAVGLLFGGAVTVLTFNAAAVAGTPLTDAKLAATVVNEVLFPLGCAFVIFLGQQVGRSLDLIEDKGDGPQLAA